MVGDVNCLAEEIGYEVRRRMTVAPAHAGALSPDVLPVNHA